ncbi:MAG: non-homologous end-joining DNA ligase, partial [Burkholderiaceae bacterium]
MARPDPLTAYKAKRDFSKTSEPEDGGSANQSARAFVVQKHWASHLHYDFRLEFDGAMWSWAVPKGPSYDPKDKRMAVQVEDHPIAYNDFEGEIPAKQYGAGKVIIWDRGTWQPLDALDPQQGYLDGNLKFALHGTKLRGNWALIRIKDRSGKQSEKQPPWLLIKEKDGYARPAVEYSVVDEMPDSVAHLPPPAAARMESGAAKDGQQARPKAAVAKPGAMAMPVGAVKADLPASLAPQLATLVDRPPSDSAEWLYEIKYDGYRMLARLQGRKIALHTRNGNDWTHKLPALAEALRDAGLPDGWYDGEIVMQGDNGIPDFQALQGAFDNKKTQQIVYFLFDLPFCAGYDLRTVPLIERRALLQSLLDKPDKVLSPAIRFSEAFEAGGRDIVESACRLGLEGVIGKKKDGRYGGRRSPDWVKLKCSNRQEFVIGGYTDPKGGRAGIGALLLGIHDADGKLRYAGKVGSGFDDKTLLRLKQQLSAIGSDRTPFAPFTADGGIGEAHWVKPKLLAEVSFAAWTASGRIRHAVFHA